MVALDSPSMNPGYLQRGFKVTAPSMLGNKHMTFPHSRLQATSNLPFTSNFLLSFFQGIMLSSISRGLGKGFLTPSRCVSGRRSRSQCRRARSVQKSIVSCILIQFPKYLIMQLGFLPAPHSSDSSP